MRGQEVSPHFRRFKDMLLIRLAMILDSFNSELSWTEHAGMCSLRKCCTLDASMCGHHACQGQLLLDSGNTEVRRPNEGRPTESNFSRDGRERIHNLQEVPLTSKRRKSCELDLLRDYHRLWNHMR
jgi:hypothetical protein